MAISSVNIMRTFLLQLPLLLLAIKRTFAFTSNDAIIRTSNTFLTKKSSNSNTILSAYSSENRNKILGRSGSHFELNRFSGRVEFGSTANLVTTLDNADLATVSEWLLDEKRVAMSIWDEKLIKDLGDSVYRLEVMSLQFITIKLAPQVDNRMWTEKDASGTPIFRVQSIDFDPNIQLLPGLNIPASSLGIDIEVVGELSPSRNGRGLEGKIGFVTSGNLTPPMRLLPVPALKTATNVLCKTITDFAIQSFQKGVKAKYREFQLERPK